MTQSRPIQRLGALAGTLSAAILLTITQASAVSAEIERATGVRGPVNTDGWECAGTGPSDDYAATSCYSYLGDWLMITDQKSDGYSAVVDWEIRNGRNAVVRYGTTFTDRNTDSVETKVKLSGCSTDSDFRLATLTLYKDISWGRDKKIKSITHKCGTYTWGDLPEGKYYFALDGFGGGGRFWAKKVGISW
ncbi:hypothetical protein ACFWIY_26235 [Streptomyces sioyaensis]|uniref:hypothetical protein n=1 Tax=Streptomyces sioyaensis TaxID=67364 RepID=UPI003660907D